MTIGVIFDLDGVIVSTDEYHFLGWQRLARELGVPFDRGVNHRQRGVSRLESLEVLLERSPRAYSNEEKLALAERKNGYYKELLAGLTPGDLLPGAKALLDALKTAGVKVAIGSSSRNSPGILRAVGLEGYFDAEADGNHISRSKPDPEVFLLAARKLGLPPGRCWVVEDAKAGVEAGLAAGMRVLAVGDAADDPRATLRRADLRGVTPDLFR